MTKRISAKHKIDRRLKINLWGRPKSPFNKRDYGPGQHGQGRKGKPTDYGIQLQAKQKLKAYYGNINERQFRNIYRKALSNRGDTTENLIALLESRLDTVIYRAKFAITVFSARQMINHGHIKVNKKRVNIASYVVKDTDFFFQKLTNGDERFEGKTMGDKFNSWFYGYLTGGGPTKYFYDYETLADLFISAGFSVVEKKKYMDSRLKEIKSIDNREDQMFFLEAVK